MRNIVEIVCITFQVDDAEARGKKGIFKTLLNVFQAYVIKFCESNEVFNILTKGIIPADLADRYVYRISSIISRHSKISRFKIKPRFYT